METFLTSVEKDLFQNTKVDKANDNLTHTGRRSLTNWRRDNLFNKESDTIMKLQDKDNRFVTVDKNTDRLKALQQIGRSSFIKPNHDPTDTHIKKFKEWADEWKDRGEIIWHDYIINDKAQPRKIQHYIKHARRETQ